MKPLPATSPRPVSTRSALGLHGGISLLALGCVASMLAACGGSPGAEIVEVYDCVLTNCKDSELLSTDALSPHAVIRGEGNVLNISAQLGQSANLLTRVRLTGADRFFAQTSSQRIELRDSDELARDELMRWLSGFRRPPQRVFIVHGEPEASEALRERIQRELDWPATVPLQNRSYPL